MKNLTKGIAAVGALAMLTGVGACGSNTADDKGHVYFLNNKPEVSISGTNSPKCTPSKPA